MKFFTPKILGLVGIFLLGPLVWFYVGNFLLKLLFESRGLETLGMGFPPGWEMLPSFLIVLYLFASIPGSIGMLIGFFIGNIIKKSQLGSEIGLVAGMSYTPFSLLLTYGYEGSFFLLSGWGIGLAGCLLGKIGGRALGKLF